MSISKYALEVTDFANQPYISIRRLLTDVRSKLQSGNIASLQLANLAKSRTQWAAEGGGDIIPPYIPITGAMSQGVSKAASEQNDLHKHGTEVYECVKASLITCMGPIISLDIQENTENAFIDEYLGDILDKLAVKYNRPSDALLSATVQSLVLWNTSISFSANVSNFKRTLAFLVSQDTCTGKGDQVRLCFDFYNNGGSPFTQIIIAFKMLHHTTDWANPVAPATAPTLNVLHTYVSTNRMIYPESAASAGYSASGMTFHTAAAQPALDSELEVLKKKIDSLTDLLASAGGGSKNNNGKKASTKIDFAWIRKQTPPAGWVLGFGQTGTPRKYCYACGYVDHNGWQCWTQHNDRNATKAMKAASSDSVTLPGGDKKPVLPSTAHK